MKIINTKLCNFADKTNFYLKTYCQIIKTDYKSYILYLFYIQFRYFHLKVLIAKKNGLSTTHKHGDKPTFNYDVPLKK